MNKQEALHQIREIAKEKILTRQEVVNAYEASSGGDMALTKKVGIAEILYYIGGAIVFIGISILVWQNWAALNFPARLIATLGASIAAYVVAFIFSGYKKWEDVGSAFYFISALVLPMGLYVLLENAGLDMSAALAPMMISGLCFALFLVSLAAFRKNIFTLFSILFGTWFFFALTNFLVAGSSAIDWHFFAYRALVVGLSYILLGYAFAEGPRAPMTGFLYGFGILGFLTAAISLGGWAPYENGFWELLFPFLVFGTLFLSVHLKSKSFLTFGSLFLMIYILKITSEYFTQGLGWPLALVLAGLMLIGVGWLYIYLKNRYVVSSGASGTVS